MEERKRKKKHERKMRQKGWRGGGGWGLGVGEKERRSFIDFVKNKKKKKVYNKTYRIVNLKLNGIVFIYI